MPVATSGGGRAHCYAAVCHGPDYVQSIGKDAGAVRSETRWEGKRKKRCNGLLCVIRGSVVHPLKVLAAKQAPKKRYRQTTAGAMRRVAPHRRRRGCEEAGMDG
jgi:hypothetical protein